MNKEIISIIEGKKNQGSSVAQRITSPPQNSLLHPELALLSVPSFTCSSYVLHVGFLPFPKNIPIGGLALLNSP